MKIPQYMTRTPHFVCHPATTLRDVAKALEMEASLYRKEKNTAGSNALRSTAVALRDIADGKTWAEAFGWSAE